MSTETPISASVSFEGGGVSISSHSGIVPRLFRPIFLGLVSRSFQRYQGGRFPDVALNLGCVPASRAPPDAVPISNHPTLESGVSMYTRAPPAIPACSHTRRSIATRYASRTAATRTSGPSTAGSVGASTIRPSTASTSTSTSWPTATFRVPGMPTSSAEDLSR